MRGTAGLLALAASVSSAAATFQGFNYGATFTTGAAKVQSDFESEFKTAQGLVGTNGGFTSARLYTTIVCCLLLLLLLSLLLLLLLSAFLPRNMSVLQR